MNGLILVNAYAPTLETRQVTRMRDELALLGVNVTVMRNGGALSRIEDSSAVFDGDYDFCLYLDKDKYTSRIAERHMRLFNTAEAIELCDDKMTTHITLAGRGVPMPNTVPAPLCYDEGAQVCEADLRLVADMLGLPVIVKSAFGSMGSGVYKADTFAELKALAQRLKTAPHLYQQYIAASHGRDMRVIVVGGKVLGGILRSSATDFRSNIGLGGRAERVSVPKDIAHYAVTAAKTLGLDYCGIDFLLAPAPMLCEVNSNAFFDAFERATDINVARAYAEHIVSVMGK